MRFRIPLALAVLAVGVMAVSQLAGATHVRPKAATPLRDSMVIAQRACTAPNTIHGTPLAFPSCQPPGQVSQWVSAGTPDANGAPANFVGHVRLIQLPADIGIDSNITDVRCLPATAASVCTPANAADGPDYVGQLEIRIGFRITDHFNAPMSTTPGTMVDITFPVKEPCASTPNVAVGGTCSIVTSMNAIVPGSAPGAKRTVYQIPQQTSPGGIQVWDGGQNGVAGASDATLYLEPGVFLP